MKCINCGEEHSTMAYKCPKRKEILKEIMKKKRKNEGERKEAQKEKEKKHTNAQTPRQRELPNNFEEIMAAAMFHAIQIEKQEKGTYNWAYNEILKSNGLYPINIPDSIVRRLTGRILDRVETTEMEETEQETEQETEHEEETKKKRRRKRTHEGATPTPLQSRIQTEEEEDTDVEEMRRKLGNHPQIMIVAPINSRLRAMNDLELAHELRRGTRLKYIKKTHENMDIHDFITSGRVKLSQLKIQYITQGQFDKVKNGEFTKTKGK